METVQQNGRFTLFSIKFRSNIYSILCAHNMLENGTGAAREESLSCEINISVILMLPFSSHLKINLKCSSFLVNSYNQILLYT